MKKNSKVKLYICITSMVLMATAMFIFSLISPFQLWNSSAKMVDYDKMLVLKAFWFFALIINFFLTLYSRPRKIFIVVFAVFFVLCMIKIIFLFAI